MWKSFTVVEFDAWRLFLPRTAVTAEEVFSARSAWSKEIDLFTVLAKDESTGVGKSVVV